MQTIHPHKALYHIKNIDETEYPKVVWERKEKLDKITLLLEEGCAEEVALQAIGVPRSTYYRWKRNYNQFGLAGLENESKRPNSARKTTWTTEMEQRVYHLRKKHKLLGKSKIAVMYRNQHGEPISTSTVGRIISKLLKQGRVQPVQFLMFGKKEKKKRVFDKHAKRWIYGMKATQPGELIQVDHMTTEISGIGTLKHFNATCPITKYVVCQSYQTANSKNAADFLELMKKEFPFPILSIQVDGGAEFMADFEQATFKSGIPLWVLPPRSPEFNGSVERRNGTFKYEFYAQYDAHPSLHMIRKKLQGYTLYYNTVRPHQGIGLLTPRQFYDTIRNEAPRSHMS